MEKIFGFITLDGELVDGQFTASCSLDDVLVQSLRNEDDEICFVEEDEDKSWQMNFADLLMSTNLNLDWWQYLVFKWIQFNTSAHIILMHGLKWAIRKIYGITICKRLKDKVYLYVS